jgi:hypothetical protein
MLAHLVTSKFVDGLPIYRTCRQLERQQVQLSPGTAGTWVNTLGSESVVPLINLMNDENEIRPFSQGRRVWLFANNPLGARASANLFTLVSSARANGLEPYVYLNYIFESLPAAGTVDALEALLPWNVKSILHAHGSAAA